MPRERLPEFAGWAVIGFVAVFAELALLAVLRDGLQLVLWQASAIAAETMMLVRFVATDRWVFKFPRPSIARLVRYHVSCAAAFAVSWATLNVLSGVYGLAYPFAWGIGTAAALSLSAASSFYWVWRARTSGLPRLARQTQQRTPNWHVGEAQSGGFGAQDRGERVV